MYCLISLSLGMISKGLGGGGWRGTAGGLFVAARFGEDFGRGAGQEVRVAPRVATVVETH
jgi:hypothetical protein